MEIPFRSSRSTRCCSADGAAPRSARARCARAARVPASDVHSRVHSRVRPRRPNKGDKQPPTSASYTLDDSFAGASALSHAFSCRRGRSPRVRLSMSTTRATGRRWPRRSTARARRRSESEGRRASPTTRQHQGTMGTQSEGTKQTESFADDPSARTRHTPRARASPTISQHQHPQRAGWAISQQRHPQRAA